jgi:hypothetical protein
MEIILFAITLLLAKKFMPKWKTETLVRVANISLASMIFILLAMALAYFAQKTFSSDVGVALVFFLFVLSSPLSAAGLAANHFAQIRCDGSENQDGE